MDKPSVDIDSFENEDPMEAIYALNIGDFVAESFISDDLLDKISSSLANDPDKLKLQLEELVQIYSMDKTLSILGFDATEGFIIYDSIASTLCRMMDLDACHIFQTSNKETGSSFLSLTGSSQELLPSERWGVGFQIRDDDILSEAYEGDETVVCYNVKRFKNWHPMEKLSGENLQSIVATPMLEGNKHVGLLVFESYSEKKLTQEIVDLAEATANVFVTASRLQQLVGQAQAQIHSNQPDSNELRNLRAQITESIADLGSHQQQFVENLGAAVDARNDFTRGHSKKVATVAREIGQQMALNEKSIDLIYCAGLLGTIGKIDIPKEILSKREDLSSSEWESYLNHPNVGVGLLVQINFLSEVRPYVHYQHERYDGSGQPEGLKAQSIPLGSRILSVATAYQAMTQERPYRSEAFSHEQALKELQEEAGAKWDPLVVEALSKIPADSVL